MPTLKRSLPLYAIYFLLLALYPMALPAFEWQMNKGFQSLVFNEHILLTLQFVKSIAAFTLLGYMIAEMRGWKNESVENTLGWTFFIAAGSAVLIEIAKI